jgi:hypothetical protein
MRRDTVLCIVVIVLFVLLFNALGQAQLNDRYTREGVVVEVEGQTVSVEDAAGNVWCYDVEGDTVPIVGTEVVLTMLAMGSDTIYDDRVVDVE